MEIGDLMPLKFDGTTLWLKLKWGEFRKHAESVQKLDDEDGLAGLDTGIAFVREKIVRWDGLTQGGEPVEYTPELFDELNPMQMKRLMETFYALGEAENPTTGGATAEPPAS